MMLEQIVKRQKELEEKLKREKEKPAKVTKPAAPPGEKGFKIVGVPVPLAQHEQMEKVLELLSKTEGGPKSKKDLLLRALGSYLNNLDTLTDTSPKATQAAADLHVQLEQAGYRDFFVGAEQDGLVVYHSRTAYIGPDALPQVFNGFPVRAVPADPRPGPATPFATRNKKT